jgi:hypothetical protein
VQIDNRGDADKQLGTPVPIYDILELFTSQQSNATEVSTSRSHAVSTVSGRPFTLEPGGDLYWLPSDTRAEALVGTRYGSVQVKDLKVGMLLLIPRSGSRDELYARLLHATHQDADVLALMTLLQRFRTSVWTLYSKYGTWEDVARQLRHKGSSVKSGQTCRRWATGEAIAPDEIMDIRRVAWLTDNDRLSLNRAWERLDIIAEHLREVHRGLGRIASGAIREAASGRSGENIRHLSQLCGGIDPTEILEEFEIRQIRSIGPESAVPSNQLRRPIPVQQPTPGNL